MDINWTLACLAFQRQEFWQIIIYSHTKPILCALTHLINSYIKFRTLRLFFNNVWHHKTIFWLLPWILAFFIVRNNEFSCTSKFLLYCACVHSAQCYLQYYFRDFFTIICDNKVQGKPVKIKNIYFVLTHNLKCVGLLSGWTERNKNKQNSE